MKKFKAEELLKFDGKEGRPQYIAYMGKVYDVSQSSRWKTGIHMNKHQAGRDLSEFLPLAPHNEEVFLRYPMVGELSIEKQPDLARLSKFSELLRSIMALHPHPISIHFPIALMLSQSLFTLIFLLTGKESFETSGYYVMFLGALAIPMAMSTGFLIWRYNYHKTFKKVFIGKMIFSVVLLVLAILCTTWRTLDPQILIRAHSSSWLYVVLNLTMAPTVVTLGYLGGKITFPR